MSSVQRAGNSSTCWDAEPHSRQLERCGRLLLFPLVSRQLLEFTWRQISWFSRKFSETFPFHDVTSNVGVGIAQRADVPCGPLTFRIFEDDVSVYSTQRNPQIISLRYNCPRVSDVRIPATLP